MKKSNVVLIIIFSFIFWSCSGCISSRYHSFRWRRKLQWRNKGTI